MLEFRHWDQGTRRIVLRILENGETRLRHLRKEAVLLKEVKKRVLAEWRAFVARKKGLAVWPAETVSQ